MVLRRYKNFTVLLTELVNLIIDTVPDMEEQLTLRFHAFKQLTDPRFKALWVGLSNNDNELARIIYHRRSKEWDLLYEDWMNTYDRFWDKVADYNKNDWVSFRDNPPTRLRLIYEHTHLLDVIRRRSLLPHKGMQSEMVDFFLRQHVINRLNRGNNAFVPFVYSTHACERSMEDNAGEALYYSGLIESLVREISKNEAIVVEYRNKKILVPNAVE